MWVATAASSAIKQHVPDDNLAYLGIGSETGEVEEPGISSGTKVASSCCGVEGMHVSQSCQEQGDVQTSTCT